MANGRVREGRTETDSDGQPGGVHGRIRGLPGVGGSGFGEGPTTINWLPNQTSKNTQKSTQQNSIFPQSVTLVYNSV